MKSTIIRTALITSLVTAMVVSGIAYAVPHFMNNAQNDDNGPVTLQPQPAVYHSTQSSYARPRLRPVNYSDSGASYEPATYSQEQPVVRKHRSTETSILIVAGSSAAGAGIGALAGGKKGAGIGAIAGGLGGLIYDRATANR